MLLSIGIPCMTSHMNPHNEIGAADQNVRLQQQKHCAQLAHARQPYLSLVRLQAQSNGQVNNMLGRLMGVYCQHVAHPRPPHCQVSQELVSLASPAPQQQLALQGFVNLGVCCYNAGANQCLERFMRKTALSIHAQISTHM